MDAGSVGQCSTRRYGFGNSVGFGYVNCCDAVRVPSAAITAATTNAERANDFRDICITTCVS